MKTKLLTISAFALLLLGQSSMAFEVINAENGYDPAYQIGWVDDASQLNLDMVKTSYISEPSSGFQVINAENDYDPAYQNGWVPPDSASRITLDLMVPSYRSEPVDMHGQFEDPFSINYFGPR